MQETSLQNLSWINSIVAVINSNAFLAIVGALAVTVGSNVIAQEFQKRAQRVEAMSFFEQEAPRYVARHHQIAALAALAIERSCLRKQNADAIITDAPIFGVDGKTCRELEKDLVQLSMKLVDEPLHTGSGKVKATFKSTEIRDLVAIFDRLLDVMGDSRNSRCVKESFNYSRTAYNGIIELMFLELDGSPIVIPPQLDAFSRLKGVCEPSNLCRHALARDRDALQCGVGDI